jgi:hypothetical protein
MYWYSNRYLPPELTAAELEMRDSTMILNKELARQTPPAKVQDLPPKYSCRKDCDSSYRSWCFATWVWAPTWFPTVSCESFLVMHCPRFAFCAVFLPYKDAKTDILLPRLVFCGLQLLGMGIAMWKVSARSHLVFTASPSPKRWALPTPQTCKKRELVRYTRRKLDGNTLPGCNNLDRRSCGSVQTHHLRSLCLGDNLATERST